MRFGGRSTRGSLVLAATIGWAGACTYDFEHFALRGSGGSGQGGSAAGAGEASATSGAAGQHAAGAGGAGGAESNDASGADAGSDVAAGGSASAAGAGGGTSGGGGQGGEAMGDASGDAAFDCASVQGIVYQGHCYFGRTGPFTWDTAAVSCPFGAHLVTITSSGEEAVAQQVLPNQDRWIGMRKPATAPKMEQFFYWVTGETFTPGTSYTDWDIYSDADREPNFTGDCVRMEFNSKWADDGCTKAYAALCESE